MKKSLFLCALLTTTMLASAAIQNDTTTTQAKDSGFVFTVIKELPITSVKDQNRSGTCWAFSAISFIESELIRMGKGEYDLAEMFVVHKTMIDRAKYYIRMRGESLFACGGSAYDVMYCMKNYGIVPQKVMPGIMYGDTLPVHTELDAVAGGYVKALVNARLKKLTPVWAKGLDAIYDTYLGACPEEFDFEGKHYTPLSFAESLGFNPDDYVSITSFTHHPFYTRFALEVPDNWRMDQMYNVPIDELMAIVDNALEKGYTVVWGADVSETGFTRKGIGVVPDADHGADITGSDAAKWLKLSAEDKRKELTSRPLPEKEITQEMRQEAFDNWETTDDHGMHIYGIATDQNGKPYFMVKNSWGTQKSDYKGTWYISRAFMEYKTLDILVHKDAIPKDIRKKLGIK